MFTNPTEASGRPIGRAAAPASLIRLAVLAIVLVAAWALPPRAQAHGTGSRWLSSEEPSRAVYFHYSTGDPMAWVKIRVFGPDDDKTEFVVARTDRNGKFAFLPDRPGSWRVEASDDEGHKAVAETEWQPPGQAQPGSVASLPGEATPNQDTGLAPLWLRAVFGASLICNIFIGAAFIRRRKHCR